VNDTNSNIPPVRGGYSPRTRPRAVVPRPVVPRAVVPWVVVPRPVIPWPVIPWPVIPWPVIPWAVVPWPVIPWAVAPWPVIPWAVVRRWPVVVATTLVAATLPLIVLAATITNSPAPTAVGSAAGGAADSVAGTAAITRTAPAGVGVDRLRQDFALRGYQVEPSIDWAWLSPPVTTFRVHDPHRGRALLVQVFADEAVAQRAQQHAAPVRCYAASTWIRNVAVFQSTADSLRSCLAATAPDGMGPAIEPAGASAQPSAYRGGVDAEFVGLVVGAPATAEL
jgi:hypothetical protein